MGTTAIPPNDPKAPRWLLDLEKWEILPYTEVPQEILDREGYGVVSYTWGYIADYKNLASDTPRGLLWDVPGIKANKWSLSEARATMNTIGTRFIWWDWMCVPQGGGEKRDSMRALTPELRTVQAQEIGKQFHIYSKATQSIVWLHSTSWKEDSALKTLCFLKAPREGHKDATSVREYIKHVESQLEAARNAEHWLKSGWTLQEGVLLGTTDVVDGASERLSDARFLKNGHANVHNIGDPVSTLAHDLAAAYFFLNQGHEVDTDRPSLHRFAYSLPKTSESEILLRHSMKRLVSSGLVGFQDYSPIYILAGKQSRSFYNEKDACWALVGAMGLDHVPVSYDVPMDEVRRIFLVALIQKFQWMMLFLPFPEFGIEEESREGTTQRKLKWLDVVDGVFLPILFLVEPRVDPELPKEMPILHFDQDIRIQARANEKLTLYRPSGDSVTWFRHYRQDSDGLRIVSPRETGFAEDDLLSGAWLLPLFLVDERDNIRGKRCLVLLQFSNRSSEDQPSYGVFGGLVDIWGLGLDKLQVEEIILGFST